MSSSERITPERCARCAAAHKSDEPCASPMGAVRGCWPTPEQVAAFVALERTVYGI